VGGLVGTNDLNYLVEDSYWDIETTGQEDSANGTGLTTNQMTGANASAAGNMDGFDFDSTWYITSEYPSLERPFEGEGTEAEPYELEDVFALQEMRKDLAANYTLVADIDASETEGWFDGAGFDPVGPNTSNGFTGHFDGPGYTISDLVINKPDSEDTPVGLFGSVSENGEIRNVALENASVTGDEDETGTTGDQTGALVGYLEGTVINSSAEADVIGGGRVGGLVGKSEGDVIDSYVIGTVEGTSRVGGLVGDNSYGEILTSHATGNVSGDSVIGVLVGSNSGEVSKSHAMGNVDGGNTLGGLAGRNTGKISESYTTSDVENSGGRVGGLVGDNRGEILKSYATGDIASSGSNVGGLVGVKGINGHVEDSYWDIETTGQDTSAGDGEGLTTAQMTGANASADGNMDGFDFERTWYITAEYPSIERPFEGGGTAAEPYELKNVLHLQEMRKDLSANYRFVDNIDASETEGWFDGAGFEPIGTNSERFEGTISGDGHTISNLTVNRSEMTNVGLFGVTDGDSTVENVGLVDVNIHGDNQVGGLVGFLGAGATVSESYVTGTVGGNEFVGGLVGYNFEGTVSESYAIGAVEGTDTVGGLVGENFEATVSASYATGTVNGTNYVGGLVGNNNNDNDDSEVITSYATGDVDGTDSVGGLIGDNSGAVIDSYWDTETTNQTSSDGGSGLSTAQMTGLNATESENMAGLDFENNWTATDSYPLHQWSVDDLTLSVAAEEIIEGETTNATVTLTTADEREVPATSTSTYNSSPTGVVSLDNVTGEIRADSDGSTTITATLIELTDSVSLSVLATPSSGGSGGGFGGSSSPPTEQEEEESEQDGNDTDDEVDADPEQEADDTDDEQEVDDTEQGADEPETEADDTDDESAIDDTEQSDDEPETEADDTGDGIPGFGLLAAAFALLIAAAFWRRQL